MFTAPVKNSIPLTLLNGGMAGPLRTAPTEALCWVAGDRSQVIKPDRKQFFTGNPSSQHVYTLRFVEYFVNMWTVIVENYP